DTPERRNRRMTLTLGNGSAHVELESFGGTIALRRPGEPRPEIERKRPTRERAPFGYDFAGPMPMPMPVPAPPPAPPPMPRAMPMPMPMLVPMPDVPPAPPAPPAPPRRPRG